MQKKSSFNWWPLIIVLIILVLAFAFFILPTWKALGISEELESTDSLAERQKKAALRTDKLKYLVQRKGIAKKNLLRKFIIVYSGIVISFIASVTALQLLLNFILRPYTTTTVLVWDGVILSTLGILYTLITWKKFSLAEVVTYCGTKIKNWVYGKYVNVDEQIQQHEQEINELKPLVEMVVDKPPNHPQ